ncbi:hypothetical protein Tco_0376720, partial [Tanacetum coccineum]
EQAPPSLDYVPGTEYPKYLAPANDEIIVEDQPYADYASPTALSPRYVTEISLTLIMPHPLPCLQGDNDDDDSSDDDKEDEETSKEEGEEHLAPADFVVAPAVDHAPSSEETELFETNESAATPPPPPPTDHTTPLGDRISIRP